MLPELLPVTEEEIEAVTRTMRDVPLTTLFGGDEVGMFEAEFAALFGARTGVAVTSGTAALNASLMALGIGPGDEVIVTPFSFVASVSVVVQVGAIPVFADVCADSLVMDPASVAERVSERTRAVIPVHQCGFPVDIEALREVLPDRVVIVEDAAAAHGARVRGHYVGTLGDLGCFSFNIGKIMRTGEGGMILTGREEIAEKLRSIRVGGLVPNPGGSGTLVTALGCNFTMLQAVAALGRVQVRRYPSLSRRRREIMLRLEERIRGLPISPPPEKPGIERAYYSVPLILDEELASRRDEIVDRIRAFNVPVGAGHPQLLHEIDYIRRVAGPSSCPVIESVRPRVMFFDPLPVYDDEVVDRIAEVFHEVLPNR